MLTQVQARAVGLLFELTDEEIIRKLRIRRQTLEAWKRDPEFMEAVRLLLKDNRRTSVRLLSRLYLDACRELQAILRSDDHKDKPKLIIETLKASGLFKELGLEEGDYVGNLLDRLNSEEDADPEDSD